jgi:hypothetical protein
MGAEGKKLNGGGARSASKTDTARHISDDALGKLGQDFCWQARTRRVNDELETRLGELDRCTWHFERDLPDLGCSFPIPFVLFGPTGVFVLEGSGGYWTNDDVASMSSSARAIESDFPGYPSPVRPAIVLIGHQQEPQQHFTGTGEGPCWELGEGWLLPWLHRFCDRGLTKADIARLRELADPAGLVEQRRSFLPKGSDE